MKTVVGKNYKQKTNCRVCGHNEIDLVLDLPETPVGDAYLDSINDFHEELIYPVDMHYCDYCGLGQLIHVVDPKILYNDFTYETSVSLGLIDHFNIYAKDVIEIISLNDDDYIFDIGSNDGTLLKTFKSMGFNVLGIDPAIEIANKATHNGIETIPKLFSYKLSKELKEVKGCPKVITSNNTMANIDDLDEFAISVKNLLHKDGLFIFETLCLEDILDNMFFDHIYHEHISYFSINSLRKYFNKHDMELLNIVKNPSKGGSYRGFVQHKDGSRLIDSNLDIMIKNESDKKDIRKKFNLLNNTLRNTKIDLDVIIDNLCEDNKSIAGYGASVGSTTLIYYFNLGERLNFLVDDNKIKHGKFSPGFHLPVYNSNELCKEKIDYTIIIAWRYSKQIINNNRNYLDGGGHLLYHFLL